jgi:hypothetical protein
MNLLPFIPKMGQNAPLQKIRIIDDIKGVGYFFLHVSKRHLKPRGRASYRIDTYKNRQLLSLRNSENGAIICLRAGSHRNGE